MQLVSLPDWVQLILEGGAITVLAIAAYLFVAGKLYSEKSLDQVNEAADKRVAEVEKRVADIKEERDRLLNDRGRLMDLLVQAKFIGQEALDHIPPVAGMSGKGTR